MYFIFLLTALLGGFLAGRALRDGDGGAAFLGIATIVISCIACGVIGFPA